MTTCVVSVSERKRVFYLIAVLAAVGFVATSATIVVLYEAAYRQTARWLAETVESQARLIESVARFDARYGRYRDPAADTLFQIRDALESSAGLGETGEFIVESYKPTIETGFDYKRMTWANNEAPPAIEIPARKAEP